MIAATEIMKSNEHHLTHREKNIFLCHVGHVHNLVGQRDGQTDRPTDGQPLAPSVVTKNNKAGFLMTLAFADSRVPSIFDHFHPMMSL